MWVYEHILARHYGWSLNAIRDMDLQDFFVHLRICLVREEVEREFQAKLAGATFGSSTGEGKEQITQTQRLKSGAIKETETTRNVLRGEVGSLRVNKKTGEVVRFNQPELPD